MAARTWPTRHDDSRDTEADMSTSIETPNDPDVDDLSDAGASTDDGDPADPSLSVTQSAAAEEPADQGAFPGGVARGANIGHNVVSGPRSVR
jgi:hypothetical protein